MTQGNFFTGTTAGGNGLEVTDSTTTNFDVNKIILGTGLSISSSLGRTVTIESSGGGGGSGTVNSGTQYQVAYYAANGTAVSGNAAFTFDPATAVTVNPANNATTDFIVNTDNVTNALQVDASTDKTTILTEDSAAATVLNPLTLKRTTTSVSPAAGIGTGLAFETETSAGNNEIGSIIESVATGVTSTSENFDTVFKNMISGGAASQAMRIATDYQIRTGGSTTTPTGFSTVGAARLRLTGYAGTGGANGQGYEDGGLLLAENSLIQRVYTDFTTNGNIQTATFANSVCLRADTEATTTLGGSYWIATDTDCSASTIATGVNPQLPEFKGAQVQLTANNGVPAVINAEAAQGYSAVISAGTPAVPVGATGVRIEVPANETVVLQIVGDLTAAGSYGGGLGAGVLLVLGKCTLTAY